MKSIFKLCLLLLLGCFLCTGSLSVGYVQERKIPEQERDEDVIKLGATLVQVPVTVREPGGRYLIDFRKEDFKLYEDGIEQRIEFFGAVEEPFSVVLLIDSSGSTESRLEIIKSSAIAFLDEIREKDKVAIISFNDSVTVLTDLTNNRELLKRAILGIKPGEFTQVYEAVYTAVWERLEDVEGKKAVILFSDGIDTASSEILEVDTIDAIIESEDVIVYPIRYNTRPDVIKKLESKWINLSENERRNRVESIDNTYKKANEYLNDLARLSGGLVETTDHVNDLKPALKRIASELRQQYLIGYYIDDPQNRKKQHRIHVKVTRSDAVVRTRPYFITGLK